MRQQARYVLLAVVTHAVALALLHYGALHASQASAEQRQLATTATLSERVRTQQRVNDLEKIKSLLEQSRSMAAAKADRAQERRADEAPAPKPVQFDATTVPQKPQELLKQARELATRIEQIDKEYQAEELARLLKVSKEEALAQLGTTPSDTAAGPAPDAKADSDVPPDAGTDADRATASQGSAAVTATSADQGADSDGASATEQIKQMELKAREALKRRQQQLARAKGTGVQVTQGDAGSGTVPIDQQISDFIHRDVPLPKPGTAAYLRAGETMAASGGGAVPVLNPQSLHKGRGRIIGAGGNYANRVFIHNWYMIGPFQGKHGRDMYDNHQYPPEQHVLLDAAYRGKDERVVKWRYVSNPQYPLVPLEYAEDAVYYGYTELMSDREQDVTAWLGADDDAKVFVNDALVWEGRNVKRKGFWHAIYTGDNTHVSDMNLSEVTRRIHLRQGRNKIFFKLSNGPGRTFFSMVLTK